MFRKAYQKGFLTVLYAGGASPLRIWDRLVVNGHVKRVTDEDVRALVIEICGTNVATCYIYTPIEPKEVLGIKLPFLVMIIKNLKKYFSFEIMILDDRCIRRRFRVSNYQSTTKVRPFGTTMPIGLNPGWNQIQFNLADFTRRAYGSAYVEVQKIQVHANCRIRRIYFSDRLYPEDELPNEYKLFYPCIEEKKKKSVPAEKEAEASGPPPSEAGDEGGEQLPETEEEPTAEEIEATESVAAQASATEIAEDIEDVMGEPAEGEEVGPMEGGEEAEGAPEGEEVLPAEEGAEAAEGGVEEAPEGEEEGPPVQEAPATEESAPTE